MDFIPKAAVLQELVCQTFAVSVSQSYWPYKIKTGASS
jgi:hypothetical protein